MADVLTLDLANAKAIMSREPCAENATIIRAIWHAVEGDEPRKLACMRALRVAIPKGVVETLPSSFPVFAYSKDFPERVPHWFDAAIKRAG
jgi:hypothetical protein